MIKLIGGIVLGIIAIIVWRYRAKYDPAVQRLKYQRQLDDKMKEWHDVCAKLDNDKIGSLDYERDYADSQRLSADIRALNIKFGKGNPA